MAWTSEDQARWAAKQDAHDRRMALRCAPRQRCRYHEDYPLNRLGRWWYTFKALVCVVLNRRTDLWSDGSAIDAVAMWDAHTHTGDFGTQTSWRELAVQRGVLTGWVCDWYSNGD